MQEFVPRLSKQVDGRTDGRGRGNDLWLGSSRSRRRRTGPSADRVSTRFPCELYQMNLLLSETTGGLELPEVFNDLSLVLGRPPAHCDAGREAGRQVSPQNDPQRGQEEVLLVLEDNGGDPDISGQNELGWN